jgi:hypothetical protein
MKAFMFHGGRCWVSDTEHPNYQAGRRATKVRERAREREREIEREREREREREKKREREREN